MKAVIIFIITNNIIILRCRLRSEYKFASWLLLPRFPSRILRRDANSPGPGHCLTCFKRGCYYQYPLKFQVKWNQSPILNLTLLLEQWFKALGSAHKGQNSFIFSATGREEREPWLLILQTEYQVRVGDFHRARMDAATALRIPQGFLS